MVIVTEHVHEAGLAMLARPDLEVVQAGVGTPAFLAALPRAEGIGIRIARLGAEHLAQAPRLRIVSKHGVGTDAIDVAWCTAHGVTVTVTPDANTIAVAEHTMTLMLAASKRLLRTDAAVRRGEWGIRDRSGAGELAGRTVLVVGFGRIGRRVAELCRAFGMEVIVHGRPGGGSGDAAPFRRAGLDEGLAVADVVTLHLPRTAATANLFDAARIGRMKPGAILVNCARGGIVDEAALADALRDGRLAAAGVDVFAEEPFAPGSPLAGLPEVVLTPHIAASTGEGARRMAVAMAANLLAGLEGTLTAEAVINPGALGAVARAGR